MYLWSHYIPATIQTNWYKGEVNSPHCLWQGRCWRSATPVEDWCTVRAVISTWSVSTSTPVWPPPTPPPRTPSSPRTTSSPSLTTSSCGNSTTAHSLSKIGKGREEGRSDGVKQPSHFNFLKLSSALLFSTSLHTNRLYFVS